MTGPLASPRFRRRLAWTAILVCVPTAVVVGAIIIGNTGKSSETPLTKEPVSTYGTPKLYRLTPAERVQLVDTMSTFVQTAVARKHLDQAWPLLAPALRAGMTRQEWDSGNNTVVPYNAVGITAFDILYSYEGDVAFDVSLLGARSEDTVGKTFTIELTRDPAHPKQWLVASWVPKGVSGSEASRSARAKPPPPDVKPPTSGRWLIVPLALLALIVVVPLALVIRSTIADRRAARRYARDLAA